MRVDVMERISREELLRQITALIASRGTCARLQVGCVITQEGRIISSGYNGSLKQETHCEDCDRSKACLHAVHAEANAIAFAAKHGISLKGTSLYTTHSPCLNCAFLIAQAGISEVFYFNEYRDISSIDYLKRNRVKCINIK